GPVSGQVEVKAAGVVGDSAGDVDQPVTGGGCASGGQAWAGEHGEGAGEVVRDRDAGQPGVVSVEPARWQVGQGSVDEFGEDLLDDGVAAVVSLGLFQDERAVGEDGVVAPHGEQHALVVHCGL